MWSTSKTLLLVAVGAFAYLGREYVNKQLAVRDNPYQKEKASKHGGEQDRAAEVDHCVLPVGKADNHLNTIARKKAVGAMAATYKN